MTIKVSSNTAAYGSLIGCLFLYGFIAYGLQRTDFVALAACFVLLFFFSCQIIRNQKNNFAFLIGVSIVFRLIFAFSLPHLSQDFYRFIWDGRLILEGINPYINLPKDLMTNPNFHLPQAAELFNGMGDLSASHFSNYPPINQLFFVIAGIFSNNSILGSAMVLRFILILADLGTLHFGQKLLLNLGLEPHRIFWYILNPLVIIELTGNLHFEGVMLFFLVWSMYLLHQNQWKYASVILALSIATKLLPLLLLPLFYQKLGFKKSFAFYTIVIGTNLILFVPFLSDKLIENYSGTIGLWFTNFEFNASLYYLLRSIGYYFTGYNIIQTTGIITPILIMLFVVNRALKGSNKTTLALLQNFLIVLSTYFFVSTTVHPWYISNLVLIAIFTKFKFPFVWSLAVILSYAAYSNPNFNENLWPIALEYGFVFTALLFELEIIPKLSFFDTLKKGK